LTTISLIIIPKGGVPGILDAAFFFYDHPTQYYEHEYGIKGNAPNIPTAQEVITEQFCLHLFLQEAFTKLLPLVILNLFKNLKLICK
jgi:hypothetical protein